MLCGPHDARHRQRRTQGHLAAPLRMLPYNTAKRTAHPTGHDLAEKVVRLFVGIRTEAVLLIDTEIEQ